MFTLCSSFSPLRLFTASLLWLALFPSSSAQPEDRVGNCLFEGDGCTTCTVEPIWGSATITCPDICGPGRDLILVRIRDFIPPGIPAVIESCSVSGCVDDDNFPNDEFDCFKLRPETEVPDRSEMQWVCSDVCPGATTDEAPTTEAPIDPPPTTSAPIASTNAPTKAPVVPTPPTPTATPVAPPTTTAAVPTEGPEAFPTTESPVAAPIVEIPASATTETVTTSVEATSSGGALYGFGATAAAAVAALLSLV